ncbi:hypothetical protein ABT334_32765, partial [Streptomyces albidoflavus]
MAYWIARQIVNASLDLAAGPHLIWADVAYDLGYYDNPQPLVAGQALGRTGTRGSGCRVRRRRS